MDIARQRCRRRICFTYIVTFVLLFLFFSFLMFSNKNSVTSLSRLKEDVACLSKVLMNQQKEYTKTGGSSKRDFDCITSDNGRSLGDSSFIGCDWPKMQAYVDSIVKSKLKTLLDDIYSLKQQIMGSGCSSQSSSYSNQVAIKNTRVNYAADELGARIIHVLAKPIGGSNILKTVLGLDFNANPPINLLRSVVTPGSCFGFQGSSATVSIRLAKTIIVEEIALTHVPKEMTPMVSVDNAPKDFEVYGLQSNGKKELLGQWTYENAPKKRTQTYKVNNNNAIQNLVIIFSSNHGANSTCIYGVEVFGKLI
ncbi:SUN domain-containing protein 1 [Drosophila innubila]|uniref:SUN domain-containing protein 1 n=1 Tax=Drosophila innubila TaxID=198719 RepID=UPI00148BCD7C|nr:SUN domain-containing protein 1 [Drosophila innubila]